MCSKHPDPLFLAPHLRGPNSAQPGGSSGQPAAGFYPCAHPALEKVPNEIPVVFRGLALAWLGWNWGGKSVGLLEPPRRESCLDPLQTTRGYPSHLDQIAHVSTMN